MPVWLHALSHCKCSCNWAFLMQELHSDAAVAGIGDRRSRRHKWTSYPHGTTVTVTAQLAAFTTSACPAHEYSNKDAQNHVIMLQLVLAQACSLVHRILFRDG